MRKISFSLLFLAIVTPSLYSTDYYVYNFSSDVTYALVINQSKEYENEFVAGLLEIDPSGEERWTISTRTYFDDDKRLLSMIDVNFPEIQFIDNYVNININKKNNVILKLSKVDYIYYKNLNIVLPDIFF